MESSFDNGKRLLITSLPLNRMSETSGLGIAIDSQYRGCLKQNVCGKNCGVA